MAWLENIYQFQAEYNFMSLLCPLKLNANKLKTYHCTIWRCIKHLQCATATNYKHLDGAILFKYMEKVGSNLIFSHSAVEIIKFFVQTKYIWSSPKKLISLILIQTKNWSWLSAHYMDKNVWVHLLKDHSNGL